MFNESKKPISCEKVGCQLKGYTLESEGGEVYICVRLRHNNTQHIKKIKLSDVLREAKGLVPTVKFHDGDAILLSNVIGFADGKI